MKLHLVILDGNSNPEYTKDCDLETAQKIFDIFGIPYQDDDPYDDDDDEALDDCDPKAWLE